MKTLRRYQTGGTWYFVTVVTYLRRHILLLDTRLFWNAWEDSRPDAWVIMPDHFHAVVNCEGLSISHLMHDFKIRYSRRFRNANGGGRVWQNRFWDHVIRDQEDMNRHFDYIHYNPVKHGVVTDPSGYGDSSYSEYLKEGYYQPDWGRVDEQVVGGEFGE